MLRSSLLLFLLLAPGAGKAEEAGKTTAILSGYVVDSESGSPIASADVLTIPGKDYITTDNEGYFHFHVDTVITALQVYHLAYRTRRVEISSSDLEKPYIYIALEANPHLLDSLTVEAEELMTAMDKITAATTDLSGRELQRSLGLSLAETVKNKMGIAIRSMGPAPARPVIRGMGGNQVQVNQDGLAVNDMSATSPDHAVAVESFSVEEIEIIRGPRSILYTPTVLGGVINLIKDDIPQTQPQTPLYHLGLLGETVNSGYLANGGILLPLGAWALGGELTYKQAGDTQTPDSVLSNTSIANHNFVSSATRFFHQGYAGLAITDYQSNYGIPPAPQEIGAHPSGVDIELVRREYKGKVHWDFHSQTANHLNVNLSRTYFHQYEFEKNSVSQNIGTEFLVIHYLADAALEMNTFGLTNNTIIKIEGRHRDFSFGGRYNSAPTQSRQGNLAIFHRHMDVPLNIEMGLRLNYSSHSPEYREQLTNQIGPYSDRQFTNFAASISLSKYIIDDWIMGLTFSRNTRAPSVEELYTGGPHLAAYSYEIGNPNLSSENGLGIEWFSNYKSRTIDVTASTYLNSFSNYITSRNTGEINWSTLLPIYQYAGVTAFMAGAELQIRWIPLHHIHVKGTLSYIYGQNESENRPLPMMPPAKAQLAIEGHWSGYIAGLSYDFVGRQDRLDTFETPTEGYQKANLYVQKEILAMNSKHNLSLQIDNLLNTTYYNHLSRIKDIMPEPGRNIRLTYKLFLF
jgi:iron complex outermembrane receptor protein